ncbi:hypothetical protein FRX31_025307, partial [Thalictrum thalictroides]
MKPIEVAGLKSNHQNIKYLIRWTISILTYPEWTVNGIMKNVRSKEARKQILSCPITQLEDTFQQKILMLKNIFLITVHGKDPKRLNESMDIVLPLKIWCNCDSTLKTIHGQCVKPDEAWETDECFFC